MRDFADIELRGIEAQSAAATQRAAPSARRLGCHQRNDPILRGAGQHKARQIQPNIAAPRPDAARLVEANDRPQRPFNQSSGFLCQAANTRGLASCSYAGVDISILFPGHGATGQMNRAEGKVTGRTIGD